MFLFMAITDDNYYKVVCIKLIDRMAYPLIFYLRAWGHNYHPPHAFFSDSYLGIPHILCLLFIFLSYPSLSWRII